MMTKQIKLDGVNYDVRIVYDTILRNFAIMTGINEGVALSGRRIADIIGTKYTFSMQVEPNPQNPTDYDNFYEAISAPVSSHTVKLPYGQTEIIFEAYITTGGDAYHGKMQYERWRGLTVYFEAVAPQRSA